MHIPKKLVSLSYWLLVAYFLELHAGDPYLDSHLSSFSCHVSGCVDRACHSASNTPDIRMTNWQTRSALSSATCSILIMKINSF